MSRSLVGGSILDREGFVDWVKAIFLARGADGEISGDREIKGYKVLPHILEAITKETGKTEAEILAEKGDLRGDLAMELLYRVGGINGVEIGKVFKISYSSVSQERKRLKQIKGDVVHRVHNSK